MKAGIKLGWFCCYCIALMLPASGVVFASGNTLGTVFYSPAERAALVAGRSGLDVQMGAATSHYAISGVVKRKDGKSVVWINDQPVSEKPHIEGTPPVRVFGDSVLIDGKPAKVGETLDAISGESASALPVDAVKVNK